MNTLLKWALALFLTCNLSSIAPEQKPDSTLAFSLRELRCLALNIHFEAMGEKKTGKIAVGHVTLNRANSRVFPRDICKVVYQPGQFSWVANVRKHMQTKIPVATIQLAHDILVGKYGTDPTRGALYFHNLNAPRFNRPQTVVIQNHVFYK